MVRILFFDTETNGIPANRWIPPAQHKHWPHILQIAWEMWDIQDTSAALVTKTSLLLHPPADMIWSAEAAKVHGLTLRLLRQLGVPAEQALTWFAEDAKGADQVVAHNLDFDKKVVWAAAARTGLPTLVNPNTWWPATEICSMLVTKDICRIPAQPTDKCPVPKDPYKWPRLTEVWRWLWPARPLPANLHDAGADVRCLATCWSELGLRGHIHVGINHQPLTRDRIHVFLKDTLASFVV